MTFSPLNTSSSVRLMQSVLLFLLLFALVGPSLADNLLYLRIDRAVLENRVQVMPSTPQERLRTLRIQFRTAGCIDHLLEQVVPGAELPNLICTLPGSDTGMILIAASLDYKAHGDEERVQWATLTLLPLLAESLNSSPHRETLVFAALTGHDQSFSGASRYLDNLSETERKNLRGMVFLDHLGRVPPAYAYLFFDTVPTQMVGTRMSWAPGADSHKPNVLTRNTASAARALKLAEPLEINETAPTDARVFAQAKVLAIKFYSPTYATLPGIGGTEIHISRTELNPGVYTDTYNLLCVYVLMVDKALRTEQPTSTPPPR